jgi:hypothetical protein
MSGVQKMKPASHLLCTYVGFVIGSLQVLAFPNKWEGLGVVFLVTIILLIAGITHARGREVAKPIKKRASQSKSKLKAARRRNT